MTAKVRLLLRVDGRFDRKLTACIAGLTIIVRKRATVSASRIACSIVPDIPLLLENLGFTVSRQSKEEGKSLSKQEVSFM